MISDNLQEIRLWEKDISLRSPEPQVIFTRPIGRFDISFLQELIKQLDDNAKNKPGTDTQELVP